MKKIFIFLTCLVSFLLILSCTEKKDSQLDLKTIIVKDYRDRTVEIGKSNKIVMMADLALNILDQLNVTSRIVGIDSKSLKYGDALMCFENHPDLLDLQDVGKTSNPNMEAIMSLSPDLILFKGDSTVADTMQEKLNIPVVCVKSLSGYDFDLYTFIGKVLGVEDRARQLVTHLENEKSILEELTKSIEDKPTVYTCLQNKKGNFYKTMRSIQSVDIIGLVNVAKDFDNSDEWGNCIISKETLIEWNPDVIFLEKPQNESNILISDFEKDSTIKDLNATKNKKIFITQVLSLPKDYVNVICEGWYYVSIVFPEIASTDLYAIAINRIFYEMYGKENYFDFWNENHKISF